MKLARRLNWRVLTCRASAPPPAPPSSTACGEARRAFGARGGGRAPLDSLGTPKQRALAAGSSNRFEEECSCGACSMRLSCSHFDFGVSWWDMTWMVFERFACLFDLRFRAQSSRFKSATSSLARRGVYSRVRNKHTGTLINFWGFFQGLRPY